MSINHRIFSASQMVPPTLTGTLVSALLLSVALLSVAGGSACYAQVANYTDLAEVDRQVAEFTGNSIGTIGGALEPVDRRLRLRKCAGPLQLSWYGDPGRTVAVSCPAAGGWRIYVNVQYVAPAQAGSESVAVKRGDMVNVAIKGKGFTVQKQGQAQEPGGVGDWIDIRMDKNSAPVRAQIVRPGLAEIQVD